MIGYRSSLWGTHHYKCDSIRAENDTIVNVFCDAYVANTSNIIPNDGTISCVQVRNHSHLIPLNFHDEYLFWILKFDTQNLTDHTQQNDLMFADIE